MGELAPTPPPGPPRTEDGPLPWGARNGWASGVVGVLLGLIVPVVGLLAGLGVGSGGSSAIGFALLGLFVVPLVVACGLAFSRRLRWVGIWMVIGFALLPVVGAGVCSALLTSTNH